MFKVYPRKIHVHYKTPDGFRYAWSTNAFRTCRDALADAKQHHPKLDFKASFAKD